MAARDRVHNTVRTALVKDGWRILSDPHIIPYGGLTLLADLAAERILAAEQGGRSIVVEVKSFSARSRTRDFETALGQYLIYRTLLRYTFPEAKLYMAVDRLVFERFFGLPAIQLVLQEFSVAVLVFDPATEEVDQWIE